jgi:hypothetical protein
LIDRESRPGCGLVVRIFAANIGLVLDEELAAATLAVDEAVEADCFSAAIAEMLEVRVVLIGPSSFGHVSLKLRILVCHVLSPLLMPGLPARFPSVWRGFLQCRCSASFTCEAMISVPPGLDGWWLRHSTFAE